ncbi:phosphatase PAP2 family protein [Burkholderia sp. 22PA0099]|uniref:phosphatase PAP2 family protein n=1 Tax=Burkholderia sp. 22PA0099 TaxID=3237372 RepID=UPI0039C11930
MTAFSPILKLHIERGICITRTQSKVVKIFQRYVSQRWYISNKTNASIKIIRASFIGSREKILKTPAIVIKNSFPDKISALQIAWATIIFITLVDFLWLREWSFQLIIGPKLKTSISIAAIIFVNQWIKYRSRSDTNENSVWLTRLRDLSFTGQWMIALAAFCTATSILSSLSVAIAAPLIDDQLAWIDQAGGYDWLACYQWVQGHPFLLLVLHLAYISGLAQMIVVPVALGITGHKIELIKHIARLMLAILTCIAIAAFFPAASAFLHFHVTDPETLNTVSTFLPLREGTLRVIDLSISQGLVSMPSLHATFAILFAYALRQAALFSNVGTALNVLMLASTPTQGGHYLSDVIGGILLAALVIVLVEKMSAHQNNREQPRSI